MQESKHRVSGTGCLTDIPSSTDPMTSSTVHVHCVSSRAVALPMLVLMRRVRHKRFKTVVTVVTVTAAWASSVERLRGFCCCRSPAPGLGRCHIWHRPTEGRSVMTLQPWRVELGTR